MLSLAQKFINNGRDWGRNSYQLLRLLISSCWQDQCSQIAAALTYTTSLAMVPVLAVGFSIITTFPMFPELLQTVQSFTFEVFTPGIREDVQTYMLEFVQKSTGLTTIGLIVLVVTALLTLNTIDTAINRIWRVERAHRSWLRLVVYMLILIFGPLFVGLSLLLSTYLVSLPYISMVVAQPEIQSGFYLILPFAMTWLLFTFVYHWVPNAKVAWRDSFAGGGIAAFLIELAKHGFALYIAWFPTYEIVYGALAIIPLTLIWIYLLWMIVLFGAEVTCSLGEYRFKRTEDIAITAEEH